MYPPQRLKHWKAKQIHRSLRAGKPDDINEMLKPANTANDCVRRILFLIIFVETVNFSE